MDALAPPHARDALRDPRRRETLLFALLIAFVHALACGLVVRNGFDHVSDDDFARVTIAQTFAVAPKLDPSGTSWLPFPFWLTGTWLAAFGRSLASARIASIVVASAGAAAPFVALRLTGVPPRRALAASAFALLSPWSLWLGAATVPESLTASLSIAALVVLGAEVTPHRVRIAFLAALGAACLSRYETWPIAGVLAACGVARGARARDGRLVLVGLAAILGPLLWMAWNAHAHDSAFHFFHRVARFKRAMGAGASDPGEALWLYPRLLLVTRPEAVLAAAGALAIFLRDDETRRRWSIPLAAAAAQLAFLAYGNVRDGAPTHHPERALLGTAIVLSLFGMETLLRERGRLRSRLGASLVFTALLAVAALAQRPLFRAPPGTTPYEDRRAQIARGLALRGSSALVVTPCAYEHFALLAAFEAPERAHVEPKTNAPLDDTCPHVAPR